MKRYILLGLLFSFTLGAFAQKDVRKSIRKGNSAYKEQRYSTAETDYAKALELNASSKEASFNLANTYYKQGRWDEALKEYQHYLTLENENTENMSAAWSNMGNTFLKKKANEKNEAQGGGMPGQPQQQAVDNLKMSMEAYKNALRLNPLDDETRENLAIVQKMIKDQEDDGGGGNDDKQDQQQENQQEQQEQQDKKDDKQQDQQQNQNQMSQDNMQQILQAIEQQEKETQERVNQLKADQKKKQMERNKQQDKDW